MIVDHFKVRFTASDHIDPQLTVQGRQLLNRGNETAICFSIEVRRVAFNSPERWLVWIKAVVGRP